jgi:hypothetical protein
MLKRWAALPRGLRWLIVGVVAVVVALAIAWVLLVPAADWLARHDVGAAKGRLTWVGLGGLEPPTSSLSGCISHVLQLRGGSSAVTRTSRECSRLPFMVGCFWHGSGTPVSHTPCDPLFRNNGRTVQYRPVLVTCWADVPGLSLGPIVYPESEPNRSPTRQWDLLIHFESCSAS